VGERPGAIRAKRYYKLDISVIQELRWMGKRVMEKKDLVF
jgi:hypothetical protein